MSRCLTRGAGEGSVAAVLGLVQDQVLAEYEGLDKAGKGALLRREGLYTSENAGHLKR